MSTALLKKSLELVDSDFVHKYSGIFLVFTFIWEIRFKAFLKLFCYFAVIKSKEKGKQVYSELKLQKKTKDNKETRSVTDNKKLSLNSVSKIKKQHKRKENKELNKKKLRLLHKPPNSKIVNKVGISFTMLACFIT